MRTSKPDSDLLALKQQFNLDTFRILLNLSWSFMVLASQDSSTHFQSSSRAHDLGGSSTSSSLSDRERVLVQDPQVWNNIVSVLQQQLDLIDSTSQLKDFEFSQLNQLMCHVMLNGKKLGLKQPFRQDMKLNVKA